MGTSWLRFVGKEEEERGEEGTRCWGRSGEERRWEGCDGKGKKGVGRKEGGGAEGLNPVLTVENRGLKNQVVGGFVADGIGKRWGGRTVAAGIVKQRKGDEGARLFFGSFVPGFCL